MDKKSTFKTELAPGECLRIGDAVLTLVEKSGRRARLQVIAPRSVVVQRQPPGTPNTNHKEAHQ